MTEALLEVRDLVKHFPVTRGVLRGKQIGTVKAVDGVSFAIQPGETFAIVGESGCGKTTLANLIFSLMPPTRGDILLRGQPISRLSPEALMLYRKSITAVFQDPYGALNPRMRIGDVVTEPMAIHGYPRHIRRQRHQPQRLIALTGYGQHEDRQRCLAAGFDEHLVKPIDPLRLTELLENVA